MDDDASVAKECRGVRNSREEDVRVLGHVAWGWKRSGINFAVLASEVTDLTGVWLLRRAFVGVGDVVRVEMATCCCAIAIFGNGVDVNVVC